jgi:hypothetical protein
MDGSGRQPDLADQLARAGVITHLMRADPPQGVEDGPVEAAALSALCDASDGPVFRIGELEYGFSPGIEDEGALAALADRLADEIFGEDPGRITLTPIAPAPDMPELNRLAVMLLDRMGAASLSAPGPGTRAILDAGYAVATATLAAEEISALVDRMSERVRAIIPAPSAIRDPDQMREEAAALAEQRALLDVILSRLPEPGPPEGPALQARLAAIEARLDLMPDPEALVERLEAAIAPLADRVEATSASLDALSDNAALVERLEAAIAPLADRVEATSARLDALSESTAPAPLDETLAARLGAIEEALARLASSGTPAPAGLSEATLVRRLTPILDQVEVLGQRVESLPPPAELGPVLAAVEGLAARIPPAADLAPLRAGLKAIAASLDARPQPATPADLAPISAATTRLFDRIEAIAGVVGDLSDRTAPETDLAPVLSGIASLGEALSALLVEPPEHLGPEALTMLAAALRTVLRRLDQEAEALSAVRAGMLGGVTGPAGDALVLALEPGADVAAALSLAGAGPVTESLGLMLLDRLSAIETRLDALEPPRRDASNPQAHSGDDLARPMPEAKGDETGEDDVALDAMATGEPDEPAPDEGPSVTASVEADAGDDIADEDQLLALTEPEEPLTDEDRPVARVGG